jgi:hypothetical protein
MQINRALAFFFFFWVFVSRINLALALLHDLGSVMGKEGSSKICLRLLTGSPVDLEHVFDGQVGHFA